MMGAFPWFHTPFVSFTRYPSVSRGINRCPAPFVVNHTLGIMIPRLLVVSEIGRTEPFVIGLRHER